MKALRATFTILGCLVAIVAAVDRPDLSFLLLFGILGSWILPGLWRLVMDLKEVRLIL